MKQVNANFVAPGRPGRWHWGLVLVVVAVAVGLTARTLIERADLAASQASLQNRQAQLLGATSAPPAIRSAADASAREMLRERESAWVEVLTALEAVAMPGVNLTSINMLTSNGGKTTVQLTTGDYQTILEYLAALNGPRSEPGALRFELQQARADSSGGGVSATLSVDRATVAPTN